jgi:2-polyprenyl-3-methyl-5-hydroxy-6-metoxy-1,4-benzoquinol methylase
MTTVLDLAAVKGRQQKTWASGDYSAVGARIHSMAELLVQAADLPAGARVLDVACGSGNAALAAARCGCRVTGLDYVPELLDRVRPARWPRACRSSWSRATPRRCRTRTGPSTRCCPWSA